MRILTVTTSYPRHAGDWAGRFVRDLNAGIVHLGHEVTTLAPWAPGLAEREDDPESGALLRVRGSADASSGLFYGDGAEANARRLGLARTVAAFRDFGRAFGHALDDALPRADLVLAHWVFPCAWWAASRRFWAPLLGVVHGADARLLARPVLGRAAAARLRGRLDAVACVSAGAWTRVARRLGVASGRVVISPMGIDPATFAPAPDTSRDARLVIGAGRLVRSKGFDLLIRACEGLGVRVVIAGEGPERDGLERLASELRVPLALPGALPPSQLAGLFRAAQAIVLPSRGAPGGRSEGVPLVAVEALACGAAVVGTGAGGIPEVLPARAIASPEPASLRRVIAEALRDPDRFRDPGARARFDRVAVAERILAAMP